MIDILFNGLMVVLFLALLVVLVDPDIHTGFIGSVGVTFMMIMSIVATSSEALRPVLFVFALGLVLTIVHFVLQWRRHARRDRELCAQRAAPAPAAKLRRADDQVRLLTPVR